MLKIRAVSGLILAFLLHIWAAVAAPPSIQQLVNEFDSANYYDLLSNKLYTRQGMNRLAVTGAHHDLCRDAIFAEFVKAGLDPYLDCFSFQDSNNVTRTACNVVAVIPGVQNPEGEIYVAGGHYDSKNNPGADDNGTGIACMLEMARIFNRYHFAKTIIFVAFDGEEIWDFFGVHRLGSVHYVSQHSADNIKAMVSIDMIGWQSPSIPNTAWLYGRASSYPVTNELATALSQYGGLAVVPRTTSPEISDHVAFANAGIPSCLLIEAGFSGNPNYHKAGDYVEQPGYIDWTYVGKMARAAIGYFATKLQPVDIVPQVMAIVPGPGGSRTVHFTGLAACRYATEFSPQMAPPAWTALETNTASPSGTFSTTHTPAGTTGFYRARFVSGAELVRVPEIIIDNPQATVVGTWSTGTSSSDKYGSDYRFGYPGTGSAYLEYRPTIPQAGNYRVYEWHPQGSNRTTEAPVQITYAGGAQTVRINQQINGGTWMLLGTFPFVAGTGGYVRITDNFSTGSVVLADAVRFELVP